jgi:hypothetical protein
MFPLEATFGRKMVCLFLTRLAELRYCFYEKFGDEYDMEELPNAIQEVRRKPSSTAESTSEHSSTVSSESSEL